MHIRIHIHTIYLYTQTLAGARPEFACGHYAHGSGAEYLGCTCISSIIVILIIISSSVIIIIVIVSIIPEIISILIYCLRADTTTPTGIGRNILAENCWIYYGLTQVYVVGNGI